MSEKIKIISIHSQKGGTGKTSLALSLALHAASVGKKPLVIDADLSGTTLRDILHFKAGISWASSIVDYFHEPEVVEPMKYISVAQIQDQREKATPPYEISAILGAASEDYSRIMSLVYKETHTQYLKNRVEQIINAVVKRGEVKVIIIDNSPGSWGLSRAILEIVTAKELTVNPSAKYDGFPMMVSSADLNDLISCFRVRASEKKIPYVHVINKSPHGADMEKNINSIAQALEEKAAAIDSAGYRTYATQLKDKQLEVKWIAAEDVPFSRSYTAHLREFTPVGNIAELAKNFGF